MPNHPLGGTTVGALRMYLTGPVMKIMVNQAANRVGSYKLPEG